MISLDVIQRGTFRSCIERSFADADHATATAEAALLADAPMVSQATLTARDGRHEDQDRPWAIRHFVYRAGAKPRDSGWRGWPRSTGGKPRAVAVADADLLAFLAS